MITRAFKGGRKEEKKRDPALRKGKNLKLDSKSIVLSLVSPGVIWRRKNRRLEAMGNEKSNAEWGGRKRKRKPQSTKVGEKGWGPMAERKEPYASIGQVKKNEQEKGK